MSSRFVPASPNYTVARKRNPIEDHLPRMPWLERLKTDFRFAGPGYRVKTRGQAIRLLLSPFWAVPDLISPSFIQNGDRLYAKPVETLAVAMRGLMSKNYREALQNLRRIPLYHSALHVLREWDIEGINRELTLLQREPRDRTFSDFQPLLTPLLRPLFQLSRLNPHVHILPGLAKMYEFARMYMTSTQERELVHRYYTIAREQLPLVFADLRLRLYPVLLKLLSDSLLEPDQFYIEKEEAIWALLGLTENDLIKDLPESLSAAPQTAVSAESAEPPPEPVPRLARRGFELLDDLFPRAGWQGLDESPDLFAYFQSLLEFPKGSDHIPIDDAIQVIQPLSEVLQQLFYGFQNIQWGTTTNENGEIVRLQEELDKRVARWHFFHEEFFGKNYLPLLQEYCREIERAGPISNDARRREHQLLWFKRNYLLPHLVLPVMDDVRVKSLGYPNLSVQVREMLDLLTPIAVELDQRGRGGALVNPDSKVKFPVSSMVSQRFQHALRRMGASEGNERRVIDQGNNRALVFYTVALLSSLDDLLARPTSILYSRTPKYLYRTSGNPGDDKPVYNAPQKNSLSLLKKLNEQLPADVEERPWPTRSDDLYGALLTLEDIKTRIREHRSEKKPFCLVAVHGRPPLGRDFVAFAGALLSDTQYHLQDDGSYALVLKDTTEEAGEDFARRLLDAAARRDPPLALVVLVIPFAPSWQPDRLLTIPAKGWTSAAAIPSQVLGVWAHSSQAFEFRTDVPILQRRAVAEEPAPSDEDGEESDEAPDEIPVEELPAPDEEPN